MLNGQAQGLETVAQIARKSSNSPVKLVMLVMSSVIDAVDAAGELGAPSGLLFAALQDVLHIKLDQYQGIMDGLERSGLLTKEGLLYYCTEAGRAFAKAHS